MSMRVEPLTRRGALVAAVLAPFAAAGGEGLVEPNMRLASSAPGLTVALTFDACPGAFDMRIASALIATRTPATLFLTGLWMRRNPEALALLLAHRDLFSLQNHGFWHLPPVLGARRVFGLRVAGDLATVRQEVAAGAAAIEAATGAAPRWYRAAAGLYSPAALAAVRALGVRIGGYSVNGDMGASLPAAAVARRLASAANGAVTVAHINQPHRSSGAGVVQGILGLRGRGARFVRLDELGENDVAYG